MSQRLQISKDNVFCLFYGNLKCEVLMSYIGTYSVELGTEATLTIQTGELTLNT